MKSISFFALITLFFFANAQKDNTSKTLPANTPKTTTTTKAAFATKSADVTKAKNTAPKNMEEYIAKNKVTKSEINPNAKPFAFTGSLKLNYESNDISVHNPNSGNIRFAFDGYKASLMPTFANNKFIVNMNTIINTRENELMNLTIDKTGKKSGLLLKLPKPVLANENATPPVIKKTGQTKEIQGYKCEKYIIQYGDTSTTETWVTNDLVINTKELLIYTNKSFKGKSPFYRTSLADISGTSLESVITHKNGTIIKITLTEINKNKPNPQIFNPDGYNVADARSIPMYSGN